MTLAKKFAASALTALALLAGHASHATTLTYNAIGYYDYTPRSSFTESGFVTTGNIVGVAGLIIPAYAGGTITVARQDGGAFSLSSIDMLVDFSYNVTVFGQTAGGSTVQTTFALTENLTTYHFGADFNDLLSFYFVQGPSTLGGDDLAFDNVVVGDAVTAAVPEPGSLALLGLGLAGVAALRRRKRA